MHDIQNTQLRDGRHKHGGNNRKILCDIVCNGEGGKRAAGDEQLLADFHHLQDLGGIGVQIHHIGGLLGRGGAGVHGKAHVCLGEGGRVIGAVAGHGDDLSLRLLFFDDADLVLRLALGYEAVHPGLFGDSGCGQGVIAGTHDGLDTDRAQTFKTLCHAGLYGVFQVNHAEHLIVLAYDQRSAAQRRNLFHMDMQIGRNLSALRRNVLLNRVRSAFANLGAIREIHAAHAGLGCKLHVGGARGFLNVGSQTASQLQRGFALGGFVAKAGQRRAANQIAAVCPFYGEEISGQAVAKGNGAGLVQNHGVYIAAGLDRLAGHGDHIEAGHTVHTGNADGGEQAADGGGDQTNHQGNQGGQRQLNPAIHADGIQGDNHDQENDGQGNQKRAQCDFVGRFFAGGAFHQRDHPIQKAVAGIRGDADFQPVRHHGSAAGHGAEVAAALPNHGSGFTGDGRFIHRRNAFDHLAVTGNHLAGRHHHNIALFQLAGRHDGFAAVLIQQMGLGVLLGFLQAGGLGLAPALRHRLCEVGKQHRHQQNDGNNQVVSAQSGIALAKQPRHNRQQQRNQEAGFHHEHDRILEHIAWVQLFYGTNERLFQDLRGQQLFVLFLTHSTKILLSPKE